MRPLEFLREEHKNVDRALEETLRHDYGPDISSDFYDECASRLEHIKKKIGPNGVAESDLQSIAALLGDLGYIATLISLIERSRLGEFSWPFADELRNLARTLLAETDLLGETSYPIVHVVADGRGYRIRNEDIAQSANSSRRFTIVLFPRPLKDHVLLHTIFGHELGHAALSTNQAGVALQSQAYPALTAGTMASNESATAWLNSQDAPPEVKTALADYQQQYNEPFRFADPIRNMWLHEFLCDLCGLLLFGPAFLAAHRAIIEPAHPNPLKIDLLEPTHPPYGVRHKMLVRAMRLLHWHRTITVLADGDHHSAESLFLTDLTREHFPDWAQIFSEQELEDAIQGIKSVLQGLVYEPPSTQTLKKLVDRLKSALPPIVDGLNEKGEPQLSCTDFRQILHAGWVFWSGRAQFSPPSSLPFLQTNQLCNQALLQQRATNEFLDG